MAALSPCSHREFIRKMRKLGYAGPFAGGKHQHMTKAGAPTVRVPNPHQGDISVALLKRILNLAQISLDHWMKA